MTRSLEQHWGLRFGNGPAIDEFQTRSHFSYENGRVREGEERKVERRMGANGRF